MDRAWLVAFEHCAGTAWAASDHDGVAAPERLEMPPDERVAVGRAVTSALTGLDEVNES
jgi:hypothetical protein